MTFTKEQAQWLLGAIDLRVKTEGLQAAGPGLTIATTIQRDFEQLAVVPATDDDQDGEDVAA